MLLLVRARVIVHSYSCCFGILQVSFIYLPSGRLAMATNGMHLNHQSKLKAYRVKYFQAEPTKTGFNEVCKCLYTCIYTGSVAFTW